jgi:hypothetical protein
MPEHEQTNSREDSTIEVPPYESPAVEDLDTVDGPAVTAAGNTKSG